MSDQNNIHHYIINMIFFLQNLPDANNQSKINKMKLKERRNAQKKK